MSRGRHHQPAVGVIAFALAVVACGPVPATVPPGDPKPTPRARVSAAPTGEPPGATPTPAGTSVPTPVGSPTTGPTSAPGTPGPGPSAVATPLPRLTRIEAKLIQLARITFGQNRAQRAADKAFEGPGGAALIGDQGASIISNNGSGLVPLTKLITDNGAGIVSNNGGSVVSNNGGNLISDKGGAYRLAQAAPSPVPSPDATIQITPKAGETQTARRIYPDGITKLTFKGAPIAGEAPIRTVLLRDGKATDEAIDLVVERYADEAKSKKVSESSLIALFGEGRFAQKLLTRTEHLQGSGRTARALVLPGSFVSDEATGGLTHIERATYDLEKRTADYRYRYASFGLVEEGKLQDMVPDANGGLVIVFWDPMALDDGESVVTTEAGARVYTKRQKTVGGVVTRDFDFGDGVTLSLKRVDVNHWAGRLSEGGTATADVALENRPDGSAVFTITFDDAKDRPVTVGYGLGEGGPSARPSTPPTYSARVITAAGSDEAGSTNGPPALSRFRSPTAIALAPGELAFYVADTGNHTIRRAEFGGDGAFTTYAGDGTAGFRDGARAQAQFNQPTGLAVAGDGTVYVSEAAGHRVRAIAPDGTVSTLAGEGKAGTTDGTGTTARFDRPGGLALDAAGRLYVADTGNQVVRRIETAGADKGRVTTIAGSPDAAGMADGTGTAARFSAPTGLKVGPDGAVYVADKENRRIRRVTAEGVVTTIAGTDDPAAVDFDGPALASGMSPPVDVAFDLGGTLYVATEKDVRVLTPGGELFTLAGPHVWSLDDVPYQAGFARCAGITFMSSGIAMVVDRHRIRWILPAAVVQALAAQQR